MKNMWTISFQFVVLISCGFALQNQYTIFQENMTLSDIDYNVVLDAKAGVFSINETTNGLTFTFAAKIQLPKDTKFSATAFKKVKGEYKLGLINIFKSIPAGLEMEMFDLQTLFLEYCRPPIVWPIRKEVSYHCSGWTPDSTKFPPHLPAGQWKVPISMLFANNTKFAMATWYLKLTYKK